MIPYTLSALFHKLEEARCGPVRAAGDEYRCRCPAHADTGPSFYVRLAGDKILLRCGAGCPTDAVTRELDLDLADLFVGPDDPQCEWDGTSAPTEVTPEAATSRPAGVAPTGIAAVVYAAVLGALELSAAHRAALAARGLASDRIEGGGYRTADPAIIANAVDSLLATFTRDDLLGVPRFELRGERLVLALPAGLVVPVRNPGGGIIALKVRRDDADGGAKYVLASSKSAKAAAACHVPVGVAGPAGTVRVTEGELKADIAFALSGLPTIGVPGVNQWALAIPVLRAIGVGSVRVAMDKDGKTGTVAATIKALEGLAAAGFEVEYETWDPAAGKGVDDLLAGGGPGVRTARGEGVGEQQDGRVVRLRAVLIRGQRRVSVGSSPTLTRGR